MGEHGGQVWKVGDLARLTGLTVRTLHHYEHVGVLRPSGRSPAGHRLYDEGDVRRLYQVVALRDLGLPLEAIGTALAGELDLTVLLREHLAHVEQQLTALRSLRTRLTALVASARSTRVGPDDLLGLTEEVIKVEETIRNYYTDEQLAFLERRRGEIGEDAIAAVEAEWPELIAKVQAEMDAGTDPADPRVRALAQRWMGLLEAFHGNDPGVRDSLYRMYEENSEQITQQYGGPPAAMRDYIGRAQEAAG